MISIVIPTYNERDNIGKLVKEVLRYVDEIVIVDDNSPDGTGGIADKLAKSNKNIRVIHRTGRLGLGSAIVDGFYAARGNVVGVMDADFSHPPAALGSMIKHIDAGADIVLGSRYVKGGSIENWPLKRKIVSKLAVMLARPLTGAKDPVTGFFLVRKRVFDDVKIKSGETKSWKVSLEVLVRGRYNRFVEVPYTFVNRKRGESKISTGEYKTYLGQLIKLGVYKLKRR